MRSFPIVPARTAAAGFTLVEIMVVVLILGLLAGLVVQNVGPAADEARVQTARTNCTTFASAVRLYRTAKGRLPENLAALAAASERGQTWFLEALPQDPWQREYTLRAGDTLDDWDVASCGPDGVPGTGDDVAGRSAAAR